MCFTPSYKRYKMLRSCIQDIASQTYGNIFHTINITYDKQKQTDNVEFLFDDLKTDKNKFTFSQNQHQHFNHLNAITSVENYKEYDIFIKIDDDDIYKKNYVKNIVDYFNNNDVDIISSKIKYQLNGSHIFVGDYSNLGGNPIDCHFNMPTTFAFNLKALELIEEISLRKVVYGFEDNMWRDVWCKTCKIGEIDNSENIIWYIHGKNVSTADFLINK